LVVTVLGLRKTRVKLAFGCSVSRGPVSATDIVRPAIGFVKQ